MRHVELIMEKGWRNDDEEGSGCKNGLCVSNAQFHERRHPLRIKTIQRIGMHTEKNIHLAHKKHHIKADTGRHASLLKIEWWGEYVHVHKRNRTDAMAVFSSLTITSIKFCTSFLQFRMNLLWHSSSPSILDLVSENWNYLTQGFFNFFGGFRLSEYLSDLFPKISWIKICRPNSKMIFMIPIIQFFFDKATDQRMEMEFSNFIWDENNLHTPLYKAEAATSRIILRLLHI